MPTLPSLDSSDKIALGVLIPATIASIAGVWYGFATLWKERFNIATASTDVGEMDTGS